MMLKPLQLLAVGMAYGFAFIVAEMGQNVWLTIGGYLLSSLISIAVFRAVTNERFKNIDKWQEAVIEELKEIKKNIKETEDKAAKVNDQSRRLDVLEEFQRDFYQSRVPGLKSGFRHHGG